MTDWNEQYEVLRTMLQDCYDKAYEIGFMDGWHKHNEHCALLDSGNECLGYEENK